MDLSGMQMLRREIGQFTGTFEGFFCPSAHDQIGRLSIFAHLSVLSENPLEICARIAVDHLVGTQST